MPAASPPIPWACRATPTPPWRPQSGVSRNVAMEQGEGGARVNSVSPGAIGTGIFGKAPGGPKPGGPRASTGWSLSRHAASRRPPRHAGRTPPARSHGSPAAWQASWTARTSESVAACRAASLGRARRGAVRARWSAEQGGREAAFAQADYARASYGSCPHRTASSSSALRGSPGLCGGMPAERANPLPEQVRCALALGPAGFAAGVLRLGGIA